ncbi:MAG: tRNA guanosine(34) transglycosylase Tgt [Oscillospiraceae bacterium]|jgi:queuine tRNA-ribosyltransferase|nr:tRNA guanosine(34) transglycosylase Tgt [Oscillospiraceae bacterium]
MFVLKKQDMNARRGLWHTAHGEVETPAFMNVGTGGAIRGAVATSDLTELGCQVLLCNTYHLHIRPGDDLIKEMGGLHEFVSWGGPILTDSGGYQVFSLTKPADISEEGVLFRSHLDGARIFMTPEKSMQIQSNLGSTIAMAFDECLPANADYTRAQNSVKRTTRWLHRSVEAFKSWNARADATNPQQLLFGINQGTTFADIRQAHMESIRGLGLDGYAIGGLAVGETHEQMYNTISVVEPLMPKNKPRYLMGVGTPANIIECVARGIDLFDCVMPTRNARHGYLFTNSGIIRILNKKYTTDPRPLDEDCQCPTCKTHSRSYIRYLLKVGEMLGMRLCVIHNLWFFNHLMQEIRGAIEQGRFDEFRAINTSRLQQKL